MSGLEDRNAPQRLPARMLYSPRSCLQGHSVKHEHLHCFWILATMRKAAVSILNEDFVDQYFQFLDKQLGVELLDHRIDVHFNCSRGYEAVFQSGWTTLHTVQSRAYSTSSPEFNVKSLSFVYT